MRGTDDVCTKRKLLLLLVLKLLQSDPAAYRALCRAQLELTYGGKSLVIAGLVCSQQ